jgi:molybdopterin-containing oxidoreductase family membrane subunit
MTETTNTQKKVISPIWLAITGVLAILGVVAWIIQLGQGVGATSISNLNPWGIYIAGFVFFMGISAGSLVLAALPIVFDFPKLRPYAKIGAFIALVSLIIGGLYILVDIGRPERLWRIVRYGQLNSPMLWDFLLTVAYLIISTVYLRRLLRAKEDDAAGLRPLAWLVLLAGLAECITAFVFATQVGREYWYSAVQPVSFLVTAIASAGAMILLLIVLLRRISYVSLDCCELEPIAWLTAGALGIDLLLIFSEVITLAFTRSENALTLVGIMMRSPLFWVEIAFGIAALLFLLLPATRSTPAGITTGAIFALAHLVVKRVFFIAMGFAVPNIDYAGVSIGAGSYFPTLVEFGVTVGLVGLFSLLLMIGFQNLGLGDEQIA